MLLSRPLFPADDSPRQMQSIARIIGAPDQSAIEGMRVMGSHRALQAARAFSSHVEGWEILRKHKTPLEAADLLSQLLVYKPQRRLSAMACLAHPFFDSLREIEASEVYQPELAGRPELEVIEAPRPMFGADGELPALIASPPPR